MLQRSPSYLFSMRRIDPMVNAIRKVLPARTSHWVVRWRNALFAWALYNVARTAPSVMKRVIRHRAERNLPLGYDIDTHFKPRYNPWDQRLCLILDSDLYREIAEGRADVVTDQIDHFDSTGIVLKSGKHLDTDVIVTATGLQLQALGGITVSIDGEKINPHDRFVYKEHLLEDVPNMAWCIGYTNASWTLRADMTAEQVAKLLAYMRAHGYTRAYPHLGDAEMAQQKTWNLEAGYVLRAMDVLPKSGTRRPWKVRHNFILDALDHRFDRIEESMVFGRVGAEEAEPA
jgi:cation diffusion facilitator CzcD-associated flavoprotein CzcO